MTFRHVVYVAGFYFKYKENGPFNIDGGLLIRDVVIWQVSQLQTSVLLELPLKLITDRTEIRTIELLKNSYLNR